MIDSIDAAPPDEAGPADGLLPVLGVVEAELSETVGQGEPALNGNVITQTSFDKTVR